MDKEESLTDFLDDEAEDEVVEPQQEEAEQAEPAPRDEKGRFASKKGEESASPALEEDKTEYEGKATIAERRRRQEAEDRIRALEQQIQQMQQAPQPQFDPESVFSDPASYTAHLQGQAHQQALAVKFDLSEDVARDKYGDEVVDQARDWALSRYQSDPAFHQAVMNNRNPYKFVVEQYQREQIASQVSPDDLAAFRQWQQERMAQAPAQLPPTVTKDRSAAPRSNQPSAGSYSLSDFLS